MKKLIILFSALVALSSCNTTSPSQDTQMLQSKYETVYQVSLGQYITCDSVHVYHITITKDGQISATIRIK